jgi:hypothetical protein
MAKTPRHHTHDGVGVGVHQDFSSDDLWVSAELTAPKSVTDHHWIGKARDGIFWSIDAAQCSLRAEKMKVFGAGSEQFDAVGIVSSYQGSADGPNGRELFEDAGAIAEILHLGHGHAHVFRTGAVSIIENAHEAIGLGEWKRTQQHGIDDSEYCNVCADADGQRQYGDDYKARAFPQNAEAVAQILQQALE